EQARRLVMIDAAFDRHPRGRGPQRDAKDRKKATYSLWRSLERQRPVVRPAHTPCLPRHIQRKRGRIESLLQRLVVNIERQGQRKRLDRPNDIFAGGGK